MGEILKAYQTLNKTLRLGLSREQMLAAEMQFKLDFADKMKFPSALRRNANALSSDWEFTGTLTPRRAKLRAVTSKSLSKLKADALKTRLRPSVGRVRAVRSSRAVKKR
ncbi:MAG: hypothetical protein GY953_33695 [bacterium]|nr:hypothetical protein [bacterium]